ncbi:MAG: TetR/AcrR family transcriptional regulator, partial [Alphaproteobacteria bacterium]|nr:TetR/AcrR family transcriptional regulator [Alphaproteobacteria bacterium]
HGRREDARRREEQIVKAAIRFFAEVGFGGQTRELADRIGITQPLLYRYFPSKERLIERVYREVYLRRWNPEWEALLADRSLPLAERLAQFYRAYARAIFNFEWVRIFVFSGLRGVGINRRYLRIIRERLLKPICREIRAEAGLPDFDAVPLTSAELELAWSLHGGFFYMAVRKWIYRLPIPKDLDGTITREAKMFARGAPGVVREILTGRRAGQSRKGPFHGLDRRIQNPRDNRARLVRFE